MTAFAVRDAVPDDAAAIVRVRARSSQAAYAHVFPPESWSPDGGSKVEEWLGTP